MTRGEGGVEVVTPVTGPGPEYRSNCLVSDSITVLASVNSRCNVSNVSVFLCLDLAALIRFFILLISRLSLNSASVLISCGGCC